MEIVTEIVNPASALAECEREEREGKRERAERGENTNAAFSRQAGGINALRKRNSTFLCKNRRGLAIFRA